MLVASCYAVSLVEDMPRTLARDENGPMLVKRRGVFVVVGCVFPRDNKKVRDMPLLSGENGQR